LNLLQLKLNAGMRSLNGRELKEESQLRTFELISRSYGKQGRQENKGGGNRTEGRKEKRKGDLRFL